MKNSLYKKRIFVAGHNGMVGSSIVNHFHKMGVKKIITKSRKSLDLTNKKKVFNFIKSNKPEIVINCAGRVGGIMANYNYPVEFLHENINMQLNLIEACHKYKIKTFVNLGSSCIYPKESKQPIKENYLLSGKLENTNEAYALAKIIGLKSCEFYNRQFGTKYFTVMPCNLYGPNDNFNPKTSHFIPALIKKFTYAKKNKIKNVEIWGSGKPKREIMHVDDLASSIFFLLNKIYSQNKKIINYLKNTPLINVGSSREYSIKQFSIIVKNMIFKDVKLKFNKKYPDGTPRKILDSSIIKKFGWKSSVKIEDGLMATLNWYKKKY